jgi:hypothetical protein
MELNSFIEHQLEGTSSLKELGDVKNIQSLRKFGTDRLVAIEMTP